MHGKARGSCHALPDSSHPAVVFLCGCSAITENHNSIACLSTVLLRACHDVGWSDTFNSCYCSVYAHIPEHT